MTTQTEPAGPKLEDTVTVSKGRVVGIEEWTNWNGVEGGGHFSLNRLGEDSFVCHSGCDEHGGGSNRGTLSEALASMHGSFHERYTKLFDLRDLSQSNADSEVCRVMGESSRRYKILFT